MLWDKIQLDFVKFRTQTICIIILRDSFICGEHVRLHELTYEETNIYIYMCVCVCVYIYITFSNSAEV
jgi:hypothetical protein